MLQLAILGEGAGLSSANIVRLKEVWQEDYEQWKKREQRYWVHNRANVLD
jgi:hypothetical protein